MTSSPSAHPQALVSPGHGLGLLDVFRRGHLLRLLVKKDIQIRYRGSVLGWFWSYLKPAIQFLVYFVAMGLVFGLNASMPNYPIYLFSGLVIINFFNEAFSNATRSVVDNTALVKKIYLPRELFPTSSVIIAFVNFLPQVVVLLVACLVAGWHPSATQLLSIVLAMLVIFTLSLGLGLIFGAINVGLRDAQNVVEVLTLFSTWLSPVLYNMQLVGHIASPTVIMLYQLNPITGAVGLFHFGIWGGTIPGSPLVGDFVGTGALKYGLVAFVVSLLILLIGQAVFRRMEKNFAQDL